MECEPVVEEGSEATAPALPPCTLVAGCSLTAWHSGMCVLELCSRREKRKKQSYEAGAAENPRELAKKLRAEGKLPPLKKPPPKKVAEPQQKKRKRKPLEVDNGPEQQPKRMGARSGTRSHGQPIWEEDKIELDPVIAALSVGDAGQVSLRLTVRGKEKTSKQLLVLRDFLGQGAHDPFANHSTVSVTGAIVAARNAERGHVQWGCLCRGNIIKGGAELQCRRCALTFHSQCERLDYSSSELREMMEKGTYICSDCERLERVEQGYDPSLGRFIWQCRHCTRQYEEDDFHAAEKHGNRCFSMLARRQWSCVCNGQMANTKQMMATQCTKCELWFHYGCKSQYALGGRKDVCASCEKSHDTSSVDQPESERPMSRALKAAAVDKELAGLDGFHHDEFGTLSDKRVHVKVSTLGEHSGLGLFAGVPIRAKEVVSSYWGTPLTRDEASDVDTSYVVRLPNSGGALINGKPYADVIRANEANPTADGKYFPAEGAPEWHVGAGAMANDPRDRRRNNAILTFVKPQQGNKALRELARVRPCLVATRDIEVGEEVFYSYGSDKPFEHIRKQLQAQQQQQQSKRGTKENCKLIWVPHGCTK
jgi:hypothetical protein